MKRFLRFVGIVFMAITAVVTILGGVGTSCIALNPTNYGPKFAAIANYQWLYILYVLIGIGLGLFGARVTFQLIRNKEQAERNALITLAAGVVIGVIHMVTSRSLRGSSMPVDGVVYITAITFVLFLIFQIPGIKRLGLFSDESNRDSTAEAGMISIIIAGLILSIQMWVKTSHIINGVNYADDFQNTLVWIGGLMIVIGLGLIAKSILFQPYSERSQLIT
jgi:hypothetical protein